MADKSNLNLARWLQLLGFKRNDQPEFIYGIQPVQVMGDVSSLVPQIRGPSALMGCGNTSTAGQQAIASIHVTAPGGALISNLALFTNGRSANELAFAAVDLVFDLTTSPMIPQVSQAPFTTTGTFGTRTNSAPDDRLPTIPTGATSGGLMMFDATPLWVPPGVFFTIVEHNPGNDMFLGFTVQELPGEFGA